MGYRYTLLLAFVTTLSPVLFPVQLTSSSLQPVPHVDVTYYVQKLIELHRQLCPKDAYRDLVVLNLSNERLLNAILRAIISDPTYTNIVSNKAELHYDYASEYYSCNFIPIDDFHDVNISNPVKGSTRNIYFVPKRLFGELESDYRDPLVTDLLVGYLVLYDLNNTLEIRHWNRFARQITTVDPENISVLDDARDLYGNEIEIVNQERYRTVLTFDAYFLGLLARKLNGTTVERDDDRSTRLKIMVKNVKNSGGWVVPALGTTYFAIAVPRSQPKPIVSILIDPFDVFTWFLTMLLIVTIAIILSQFGELLGTRHFLEILLELVMIALAGPSRVYGGRLENRIITIFCFMGIVLVSSYQSLVISFMSFARYNPEINTLPEIEERCVFLEEVFLAMFDFKTYTEGSAPDRDNVCFVELSRDNEQQTLLIAAKLMAEHDPERANEFMRLRAQNFRHANVKFYEYPLCYYASPSLRAFLTFHVQAMFESGIYAHYYRNRSSPVSQHEHVTFFSEAVDVNDLKLLWYVFGCGCSLSALAFAAEVAMRKVCFQPLRITNAISNLINIIRPTRWRRSKSAVK